jgi:hypothetical protein
MLNNIKYLETTPDYRFIWDEKLELDLLHYNKYYEWGSPVMDYGNAITNEFHDCEIDIREIPPSIFFLGIINTYSCGPPQVPFIEPLAYFSEKVADDVYHLLKNRYTSPENRLPRNYSRIHYVICNAFDIAYLNRTGKIKSAAQWNSQINKFFGLPIVKDFGAVGTIQGIVRDCKQFLDLHKKLY